MDTLSQAAQASRVINLILDMLEADDKHQVIQLLNKEHGIRIDVARMYSDKDVAERYGVHVRTAREWIASGQLKGCQIAGRWYSRADWLDEYERSKAEMKDRDVQRLLKPKTELAI